MVLRRFAEFAVAERDRVHSLFSSVGLAIDSPYFTADLLARATPSIMQTRDGLLRAAMPEDVVGIFLLPPSIAELERRLRARGQDSEEEIVRRMGKARDDASHWREFDHVLVNSVFEDTVETVAAILRAARTARARNPWLGDFVAGMG